MEVVPHGKSSFGWPIRKDLPAANSTTPNEKEAGSAVMIQAAFSRRSSGNFPWSHSPWLSSFNMRIMICLAGLLGLLATSGCVVRVHEHRGGVYDEHYRYYGHDRYPYYRDQY
jgi:hypothetical protein